MLKTSNTKFIEPRKSIVGAFDGRKKHGNIAKLADKDEVDSGKIDYNKVRNHEARKNY